MSENYKKGRLYIYYIDDILLAISRIEEYVGDLSFEKCRHDYKTVDAVIRNFEIIGEAAKSVPEHIKVKYQHVPWEEMYYLRNKISHEYFGIDYEIIWDIIVNHLPVNKKDIENIIQKEK